MEHHFGHGPKPRIDEAAAVTTIGIWRGGVHRLKATIRVHGQEACDSCSNICDDIRRNLGLSKMGLQRTDGEDYCENGSAIQEPHVCVSADKCIELRLASRHLIDRSHNAHCHALDGNHLIGRC